MKGNWNWTYGPMIFQRTANMWSRTPAPAQQWQRCYTTSCWPRLCGTASMAHSWCCWFALYAIACHLTGPRWVMLSAGVSVSGVLIPANHENAKQKNNLLVWFYIEFELFYKSTLFSGLPAVMMAITLAATYRVDTPLNYRQEELWVNPSIKQNIIYFVLFIYCQGISKCFSEK